MTEPELYYDRQGRPISREEWARLMMEKNAARQAGVDGWTSPAEDPTRIGFDVIGDVRVSTVWLGLDHGWGWGPPLIFETMVFASGDHALDGYIERYATEEAALAGHDRVVARVRHRGA